MEFIEGPLIQQMTAKDRTELFSTAIPPRNQVLIASFFCLSIGIFLALFQESMDLLFLIPLGILLSSASSCYELFTITLAFFRKTKVIGIATVYSFESIKNHKTSPEKHLLTISLDKRRVVQINSATLLQSLQSLQPNDRIYLELSTIGNVLLKADGYRALNTRKARAKRRQGE